MGFIRRLKSILAPPRGIVQASPAVPAHEIDAAQQVAVEAWNGRAPRIVVDDLTANPNRRMRMADVDPDAAREHRFKVNDLYMEFDAVRSLGLNPRLTPILQGLLGERR